MLHVRLLLHIYICMYVYIYIYMYVCVCVCLSVCLPAWLAGWLSVCMYVYVICMYSISYVFSYTLLQTNICVESHCESRYKLVNGFPISHALSSFVARPPKKTDSSHLFHRFFPKKSHGQKTIIKSFRKQRLGAGSSWIHRLTTQLLDLCRQILLGLVGYVQGKVKIELKDGDVFFCISSPK